MVKAGVEADTLLYNTGASDCKQGHQIESRDPPELSRLFRGKANDPTKFWGNRVPPELSRLLRGKANDITNF